MNFSRKRNLNRKFYVPVPVILCIISKEVTGIALPVLCTVPGTGTCTTGLWSISL
jgi:hypothetical protein